MWRGMGFELVMVIRPPGNEIEEAQTETGWNSGTCDPEWRSKRNWKLPIPSGIQASSPSDRRLPSAKYSESRGDRGPGHDRNRSR